ncbi:interleukin-8-like [Sinocyclocheilus grahami]|uniref:interleukin-8-like n=1 Tax=Sinocyclocheilus grahami TaxID=75366 RepID=UPI0007AD089C|nr:PREDICTED: interleukin-8-like [Sinocyclocheilus grahami]
MHCKIFLVSVIVSLGFLTIGEGMSLRGLGVDPRCRCIETESRRIGKQIESVELFPPSSHCKYTEIVATLKISGKEICLDPTAPWVKKVIEKIIANKAS